MGGCHAREESQEDRAQARRPQEEAKEAPRSRRRLRSRAVIVASERLELSATRHGSAGSSCDEAVKS
jgi:hypothetical protein